MRLWLFCLFFAISAWSNAQHGFPFAQLDTIKMNHRIGGEIDSIDLIIGIQSSTIPGGGYNLTENILSPRELFNFSGGQRFLSFKDWKPLKYSGLPHIGFAYSFGGQGTQFVKTEYQQIFKHSVLLNLDYSKYRSNGFLRNGDFSHNDLQIQLDKAGKIYSFELKGSLETSDVAQNNGLTTDTLTNNFALIFLPINKENARINTKRIRLYECNYFNFTKDTTQSIGLFTQHELKIKKFEYSESDTIYGLYSQVNFDSINTQDQHQWSQIANGAGLYLKNKYNFLKIGSNIKFWNFQNLGRYRDTTEVSVFGNYNFSKNNTLISNQLEVNILGAKNEFSNRFQLKYELKNIILSGLFLFENKLPDYYQRYSIGNNYNTNTLEPEKESRIHICAGAKRKIGPFSLTGNYSYSMWNNNYFFIDSLWSNTIVQPFSIHQITLRTDYSFKALNLQPNYIFTISDKEFKIIPTHQFQVRLFLKGGIFKARKMLAYSGVDFSLNSSSQRTSFSPNTGAFQFEKLSENKSGYTNLHFFTGFQIDEFKFFLRLENIAYLWGDHSIEVVNSFPLASAQIRIGITWDFFN